MRRNENYSQCLAAGSAGGGGGGGVDTGGTPSSPPRVPGPMGAPDPANPRSSPVAGDNCEIEEGAACGPGAEFMQCCADLVASGPSFPQRFLHCAAPDGSTTGAQLAQLYVLRHIDSNFRAVHQSAHSCLLRTHLPLSSALVASGVHRSSALNAKEDADTTLTLAKLVRIRLGVHGAEGCHALCVLCRSANALSRAHLQLTLLV